jgi:molybdopterin-containing oxidoreductase family iron-sulfur binding subunit
MTASDSHSPVFDLDEFRSRLASRGEAQVWASLEELLDDEAFNQWIDAEFPAAASSLQQPGRREFLRLMGASLMLAGLAGCGEGRSDLALPYVTQPEGETPGVPRFYANAVCFEGFAQPVLARTNSGRPTKLDGNPDHPLTRGGSDLFMQSALLQLYDPDRSKAPMREGVPTTWAGVERELATLREQWNAREGDGLRILTGDITSPTLARQLRELLAALPKAQIHVFEPVGAGRRRQAMRAAFGRDADLHHALENCEVIVSFDDDLLGPGPRQVRHARGWAQRRGETRPGEGRSRLHVIESVPGLTGVVASTRLPVDASRAPALATALAAQIGVDVQEAPRLSKQEAKWTEMAARELKESAGRSLLTCGAHLPISVQALAPWINQQLGNVGQTVIYTDPITFSFGQDGSLDDLTRAMAAGAVETLVILDSNPIYAAPGSMRFGDLLAAVPNSIHVGLYRDETASACHWHLPLAHPLESWGDARAVDGTATIIQPLLAPLYSARTIPQIVAMLAGSIDPAAEPLVRTTWMETFGDGFQARWKQSLHDGFVADSTPAPLSLSAKRPDLQTLDNGPGNAVEVVFRPDPSVWDGRFAEVAWLQELPKPLTKITWDCPVAVSPRLANSLKLANGDLLEVSVGERSIVGPVWIMPGQAANTVALFLGYGRRSGQIAKDLGYSAYSVRPADNPWFAKGQVRKLQGRHTFATTQLHHRMEGFDLVREVTADNPAFPSAEPQHSLYPEWASPHNAWGMVIDLDRCIGCNACITACNVENNVLVVGKNQVEMGREMLWLRVDRYFTGDIENPRSYFQPVPCMHCEQAPCEMGCPVNATTHTPEGVNQQVYNRCIGTRTCSSYCPYKVRRFNWYDYRRFDEASRASHNPDVTVRSRGVMEKCTYCTQRIEAAHAAADKDGRRIKPGEVVTACQQACPTSAITFGNINNSEEAVSKLRQSGRHYVLLEELGTRPRTTYLARWNDEPKREGS